MPTGWTLVRGKTCIQSWAKRRWSTTLMKSGYNMALPGTNPGKKLRSKANTDCRATPNGPPTSYISPSWKWLPPNLKIYRRQQPSYQSHSANSIWTWRLARKRMTMLTGIRARMTRRITHGMVTVTREWPEQLFSELSPCIARRREKSCRLSIWHCTLQVTQTFHTALHTAGKNPVGRVLIAWHCTLQV